MLVGWRKYIVGETARVVVDICKYPEIRQNPDDDYLENGGYAVGIGVSFGDSEVSPALLLNDKQTKELIKHLKRSRRDLRRKH